MLSRFFPALSLTTLVMVFLVILAGAVVRTTGSGMGCPDWPKCFGQYIPPTDISQLPADYKVRFLVKGKEIADFDAFKTWVEYVNRLLGALLGVVIFVLCISSLSYRHTDKMRIALSLALLIVTGFVGWLGSVVVATDLEPFKITTHMLTAFLILAFAVVTVHRSHRKPLEKLTNAHANILPVWIKPLILGAIAITLLQVILGTQVREQIDTIAKSLEYRWRELWVEQVSSVFLVHRTASWIVLAVNALLFWQIFKQKKLVSVNLRRSALLIVGLIVCEIGLGVTLAYYSMPKAAQPAHLLLASGLFATQLWCALEIFSSTTNSSPTT